ncbi:hypothetical protein [Photobacterium andalusiense]|uniref:Uncharacterized protein n=1 Tax=Photobacterium andalusiense TaxID=2204296 RepID=A0A1Y6MF82_9GAMM|nr:hypothetical protein [Photobacterium andalusiense]SMY35247.1 hypothetical protein PAND9192_01916 [Photobacterium andalusiense]
MQQEEFEILVKKLAELDSVSAILNALKDNEEPEIAETAAAMIGHFSVAEIDGQQRIYHVFTQENDQGEEEEFAEWVMNANDELMRFIAWFFYTTFEINDKETYQAAGRSYTPAKRS